MSGDDKTTYRATCQIGTEFRNLDLRGVDFSDADLSYATFVDCDLYGATFEGAMLYHCTFVDCEMTKASFQGAYLSGFRLRNVDLTHAEFDPRPIVGDVRKPLLIPHPQADFWETRGWLTVERGAPLPDVTTVESEYRGVYCPEFHSAIVFSSDPENERWRSQRRREEVCKIVRIQLQANGYAFKALDYFYEERRFRRLALRPGPFRWLRRFVDFVFGQLFWGYSTRPGRAVLAYALILGLVGSVFFAMPTLIPGSGIASNSSGISSPPLGFADGPAALWRICYFLATCAFGISGLEPVGVVAEALFVLFCVTSLAILTLMIAAVSRRIGQS